MTRQVEQDSEVEHLGKLTKKRQAELLKQYPNGEAIGRAYVEYYLDSCYRVKQNKVSEPILDYEEINFLLNSSAYERGDYAEVIPFLKLEEALIKLHNASILYEQCFNHALYRCIYVVQGVKLELEAILALSASQGEYARAGEEGFIQLYEKHILMANDNFRVVYGGLFPYSLRGLYHQDFLIEQLGKIYGFDFSIMRNPMQEYENHFDSLKRVNRYLLDVIIKKLQEAGDKAIVDMPNEAIIMFKELDGMKISDYMVNKATKTQAEKYIKTHDKFSVGFADNFTRMFLP